MSLKIIREGILDSLQDPGRPGHRHLGIPPGGPMDPLALQVVNLLVGNAPGETVLELHFPAPLIEIREPALLALAGADFQASCDEVRILPGRPFLAKKGSILKFRRQRRGMRTYLAVKGGLNSACWLGSASSLPGRVQRVRKDEIVLFKKGGLRKRAGESTRLLNWHLTPSFYPRGKILFIPGLHWDRLAFTSQVALCEYSFTLDARSDRMAHYPQHPQLEVKGMQEVLSEAVDQGTIQLLPSGRIIILAAAHQATGGYPLIGHVIRAHLGRLAQVKPGETFQLAMTDRASASAINRKMARNLRVLGEACKLQLEKNGL